MLLALALRQRFNRGQITLFHVPVGWNFNPLPVTLADGREIFGRPVRPKDEPLCGPFFAGVSE
jgi:hypothetical protein